jgi:hypothetical protein
MQAADSDCMANTNSENSKRLGLAIATAVTGLVLAGGISAISLLGWVKPAEAGAGPAQTGVAALADLPLISQVVLVPIAPLSPQSPTVAANPVAPDVALTSSPSGEAARVSGDEGAERTQVQRVRHGERDDD